MFQACKAAANPAPVLDLDGPDLWLEFPFASDYLSLIRSGRSPSLTTEITPKTSVKTSVKAAAKTPARILALLQAHPSLTLAEVAREIGLTTRSVELAAAKLVKSGYLRHVGPQKGGHWEVLHSENHPIS